MSARISAIEYYLPEKIVTNKDIELEFGDWNAKKIEEKTGIKERHIAGETETSLDMGIKAAEKLLIRYDKNKIDFLILCTQSPDYYLPASSCILQDKLKLKTSIGAVDINQGCSGYIYGLGIAKGLIQSGIAESILFITAETYSKYIHCKDKANRTIFGDAAAATLIEKSDTNKILEFILCTDGSGYKNLIVPNGGMRHRYNPNAKVNTDASGNMRSDNNLYMNGPEIFNFTIENVPWAFDNILFKNNMKLDDVDFVIFHQANRYMLEYLRKKINIPAEKYYSEMETTGNTVSSAIPIALKNSIDQKKVKEGSKILLLGFGVGYSWGSTIIEF